MTLRAFSVFPGIIAFCLLTLGLVSDPIAFVAGNSLPAGGSAHAQTAAVKPLSANDVSWLFPKPTNLDDLISMADLKAHGRAVWSNAAFRQLLSIASGPAGHVAGTNRRIELPPKVRAKRAWYIASVRFDPSAPGFSDGIRDQFGQELQIRLVAQPVTREDDGTIKVHDIAVHLVFEFSNGIHKPPAQSGCMPRPQPDVALTSKVVRELVELRSQIGEDATYGKPLGVHPGLRDSATAGKVRQAMKRLLERHLSDQHLGLMTIAAIQGDPPGHEDVTKRWIFMGTVNLKLHPNVPRPDLRRSGFVALPAAALDGQQYAQMFSENNALQNRVVPTPYANNGSGGSIIPFAITCHNASNRVAGPPIDRRIGSATSDILNKRRLIALPAPGEEDPQNENEAARKILNTIADPDRSHTFNTDCVSCHTETTIFQDRLSDPIPGIETSALPGDNRYNMRAFGWAPQRFEDNGKITEFVRPTVTRRTANETAKVVNFVNRMLFPNSAIVPNTE
jgi:hypothetical protein